MDKLKEILVSLLNREKCDCTGGSEISFDFDLFRAAIGYYETENKNSEEIIFHVYLDSPKGHHAYKVSVDLIEGNLLLSKFHALRKACLDSQIDDAIALLNNNPKVKTFEDVRESLVSDENEQS